MNANLSVPAFQLHPDWVGEIVARLKDDRLRDAVVSDPRMRARIAARLASEQGLPEPDLRGLLPTARQIITAYNTDTQRLVMLAGLLWNARLLARMVTRDAMANVMGQFDRADIVYAVKLREFAPPEQSTGFEPAKLREVVATSGLRCTLSWLKALPPGLAGRLRMSIPRTLSFADDAARLPAENCADILILAARSIKEPEAA